MVFLFQLQSVFRFSAMGKIRMNVYKSLDSPKDSRAYSLSSALCIPFRRVMKIQAQFLPVCIVGFGEPFSPLSGKINIRSR